MSAETCPAWCTRHFYPTALDCNPVHRSAAITWGTGSALVIEESERYGITICVDGSVDYDEHMLLSPAGARVLASALLDAANTVDGLDR
jgi:hypothetical protein